MNAVELPRLLVLTDRSQLRLGRGLLRTLVECRDAGLTHVVLRELDEPLAARAALAASLAGLGLKVVAAHSWLPGAAGLHLPAGSGGSAGGEVAGGWGVRGRSCHSREEVARAAAEGFDYVTLSPYAATGSKPGYGPPLEAGALRDHQIPVYALGGVTPANAAQAVAEGAFGVAVMGEVMRAAEPARVVHELLAALPPAAVAEDEGGPTGRKEFSFHRGVAGAEGIFLPPKGETPGGGEGHVPAPSLPAPESTRRPRPRGGQR